MSSDHRFDNHPPQPATMQLFACRHFLAVEVDEPTSQAP